MSLFENTKIGTLELKNRIVMAPMTRSRAIDNIPNDLMATYYEQRSGAGLIITEGTAPSANGLGYARIPALFSEAQVEGWKKVTSKVHAKGAKIFAQIMHTGRVSHPNNMPEGSELVAPSAVAAPGEMWTDTEGNQAHPVPKAMTKEDIDQAISEYVHAAKNAIAAGFDGVELHGANGYLIEQFLNTATNTRIDEYGGSIENRNRFSIEVAQAVSEAIGAEKTGIRLSPYGVFNGIEIYEDLDTQFNALATELGKLNLVYIHLVDHSPMGAPKVPASIKTSIKEHFSGAIILSGGMDLAKAEEGLSSGMGDLIAFGRPFISNPDLVYRLQNNVALAEPNHDTFYTPGPEGYTDYVETEKSVEV